MDVFNQTPFRFAMLAGRIGYPGHSLTLIVKATFDLVPGGVATLLEEQPYPSGDEFYPDDQEMSGAPRYESDFVYDKNKADLLLVGTCYAPRGRPVPQCTVQFSVGNRSRSLLVTGDRHWERRMLHTLATPPTPFAEMELRYERSFGGPGYAANPIGSGYADKKSKGIKDALALPNIEQPGSTIAKERDTPSPAGFGPLSRTWEQRGAKTGTYDDAWLEGRWPWFPVDFDPAHFNAAPKEMQLDGYLRGDERLSFENLHPEHARYETHLPGQTVRCFVETSLTEEESEFSEITMQLDTLWVDMDAEQCVLVWRGAMAVESEDYEEVARLLVASESTSDQPGDEEHYRGLLARVVAENEAEFAEEEPEVDHEPVPEEAETEVDEEALQEELEHEQALEKATADLLARQAATPPLTAEQKKEQQMFLELIQQQEAESEEEEEEPEMEESSLLDRGGVQERLDRGESLVGEDLRGLDLSEMQFDGVDLTGCLLSDASLRNTRLCKVCLQGASLEQADLTAADLSESILVDADFTGATLESSRLARADAMDALFEGAKLAGSNLEGVQASGAFFTNADLTGALLTKGLFLEADFSECVLERANCRGATLRGATVNAARGSGIDMCGADLTELRATEGCEFPEGKFDDVEAAESNWAGAVLNGAVFAGARLAGADFTAASLEGADLQACDLKAARFNKAKLTSAKLRYSNLFEGNFERADLTRADLRDSNLFSAGFLDSIIERTRFEGANLKRTLLAEE